MVASELEDFMVVLILLNF